MSRVVELTQELIRFNTVNPPGDEKPAMRHLGEYLTDHGLTVEYQTLAENRINLLARIPGGGQGHLVFCGHMDVVHPGATAWTYPPFDAEIIEGRLVGRGATDMKGGVAAMAEAAIQLAGEGFSAPADLILAITCGEEVDMAGAKLMDSTRVLAGARYVVIGEPTGLDVFHAEKGVFWPRITAHGQTAHGAMPHLGVNAISFISRLIGRLEQYPFSFEESVILGMPTLSVNVISGGVKTNVVPDACAIEVDMRLIPGQDRDQVLAVIDRLLEELKQDIPVTTTVDVLQDAPPLETPSSSPLVAAAVEAVRVVCGRDPKVGGVAYATDGALIAPNLGADMVICGPGGVDQLHQPNEWVAVTQLEEAVDMYKAIATAIL